LGRAGGEPIAGEGKRGKSSDFLAKLRFLALPNVVWESQASSGRQHTPSGSPKRRLGVNIRRMVVTKHRLGVNIRRLGVTKRRLGVTKRRLGVNIRRLGVTRRRLGVNIKRLGVPDAVWESPNFVRECGNGVCGWPGKSRTLPESARGLPNFARVSAPENSWRNFLAPGRGAHKIAPSVTEQISSTRWVVVTNEPMALA
jgi:hypothetical protein